MTQLSIGPISLSQLHIGPLSTSQLPIGPLSPPPSPPGSPFPPSAPLASGPSRRSFLAQLRALPLANPSQSLRPSDVNHAFGAAAYPPAFAAFRLPPNPLLCEIVGSRPGLYRSVYAGEDAALLQDALQNPRSALCVPAAPQSPLANQFAWEGCTPVFIDYLRGSFNRSQLFAVEASLYRTVAQLPSPRPASHFTLIQGPPGTGKTRTLRMLLNVLLNQQFDAYYEQLRGFVNQIVAGNRFVLGGNGD